MFSHPIVNNRMHKSRSTLDLINSEILTFQIFGNQEVIQGHGVQFLQCPKHTKMTQMNN